MILKQTAGLAPVSLGLAALALSGAHPAAATINIVTNTGPYGFAGLSNKTSLPTMGENATNGDAANDPPLDSNPGTFNINTTGDEGDLLIVEYLSRDSSSPPLTAPTIDYNGVALTQAGFVASSSGSYRGIGIYYTLLTAADTGSNSNSFSGTISNTTTNVYLDGIVISGQSASAPTFAYSTMLNAPNPPFSNNYTFTTAQAAPVGSYAFTDAIFASNGNINASPAQSASTPSLFDSLGSRATLSNFSDQATTGSDVTLGYLSLGNGGPSDMFTAQDNNSNPSSSGGVTRGGLGVLIVTAAASAAPEPSQVGMLALMGLGLGGLMLRARKRSARTA